MTTMASYIAQSAATRGAEEGLKSFRLLRDGTLASIPWTQALCLEGRVFGAAPGATALGVAVGTFGAGAIDTDELDYLQTIPATVAVLPIAIRCNVVTIGTAAETGFHAFWGAAGVTGANSVAVTPHNHLTSSSNVSACTVTTLGDDGGTAFVAAGLIAREVSMQLTPAANQGAMSLPDWTAAKAGYVPTITGLASPNRQIAIFVNGQAVTGYIHHVWGEVPIGDVT